MASIAGAIIAGAIAGAVCLLAAVPRASSVSAGQVSGCVLDEGIDYIAADLTGAWRGYPTSQSCADWCAITVGCGYWTHLVVYAVHRDTGDGACYLKATKGTLLKQTEDDLLTRSITSGTRACGTPSEPSADGEGAISCRTGPPPLSTDEASDERGHGAENQTLSASSIDDIDISSTNDTASVVLESESLPEQPPVAQAATNGSSPSTGVDRHRDIEEETSAPLPVVIRPLDKNSSLSHGPQREKAIKSLNPSASDDHAPPPSPFSLHSPWVCVAGGTAAGCMLALAAVLVVLTWRKARIMHRCNRQTSMAMAGTAPLSSVMCCVDGYGHRSSGQRQEPRDDDDGAGVGVLGVGGGRVESSLGTPVTKLRREATWD